MNGYAKLAGFTIEHHGDARERSLWPYVRESLSNYEVFWREVIVLLTNRIVPSSVPSAEMIRLRSSIPRDYEALAMCNYSLFYYTATAYEEIAKDRIRQDSGEYLRPERVFAAMKAGVEQSTRLQSLVRDILQRLGITAPRLPKHPDGLYKTIGTYRNALLHDPVLGRAVDQRRELLPPQSRLPKKSRGLLLWRDAAAIPTPEMVDILKLEQDLWVSLAKFLQDQWKALADVFIEARGKEKYRNDLELGGLLPIQFETGHPSVDSSLSASGAILARSDTH